jgi:hypothetical protein
MRNFYYVHTGHRIGLDRFRRAVAILNALDTNITLLTSDFRIAQVAKDFGIQECVGIDVVRNIPYIAQNGDNLIFDSAEANPLMLEDMRNFFSNFLRVSDDQHDKKEKNESLLSPYLEGEGICYGVVVDEKFFKPCEKKVKISYFFGDDDYEKDLEKHFDFIEGLDVALGLGFYYFLDYEDMLKEKFSHHFEFEEYDEMIMQSEILLTASPQAVLDSLATGGKPIYFQREDYTQDFCKLFEDLGVPIVKNYDKKLLNEIIINIGNVVYKKIENNSYNIVKCIKENLNL